MRFSRWMLGALVGLALLAFVADALIRRVSFETFQLALQERLSSALGVEVEIAGAIHLELLPSIQLEVEGLTVANPPGRSSAHLLEIRRLWLDVEVLPLIRSAVVVHAVEISDADLRLETDAAGRLILPPGLEVEKEAAGATTGAGSFRIHRVNLDDIRISYRGAGEQVSTFELDRVRLAAEDFASPVHATGTGAYPGGNFEFVADTGSVDSLFKSSAPVDIKVRMDEVGSHNPVRLRIDGSIRDVPAFAGVELNVEIEGETRSALQRFVDSPFPESPLRAEFRISDANGSLGVEGVSVKIGSPEVFEIDLRGSIDDIRRVAGIDLEIDLTLRDLGETAALFDAELPAIGPIEMKGRIQGSDERLASRGQALVGETRFEGEWTAAFAPGRRRHVEAVLESSHVRLVDFGLAQTIERPESSPDEPPSLLERWWSEGESLPLELLRDIDLDLDLRAQLLSGRGGFELEQVRGDVDLEAGVLSIHDVSADYDEGRVAASLQVDARPEIPLWSFQLEAYDVNLTRTVAQFSADDGESSEDSVGRFDVSADLTTTGATRAGVTSALAGRVGAMLREGNLVSSYGNAFFLDYLRFAVPQFLTGRGANRAPAVQCLLAVAPIVEGVAEIEQLYLEGDRITVAGTGSIDLAQNEFHLRLTPRVHDPGLVSVAATVDVTGPIESPKFTPLTSSLAASAGRALFENAMRPVRGTLRVGRQPASTQDDPCAIAAIERRRDRAPEASEAKDDPGGIAEIFPENEPPSHAEQTPAASEFD